MVLQLLIGQISDESDNGAQEEQRQEGEGEGEGAQAKPTAVRSQMLCELHRVRKEMTQNSKLVNKKEM